MMGSYVSVNADQVFEGVLATSPANGPLTSRYWTARVSYHFLGFDKERKRL